MLERDTRALRRRSVVLCKQLVVDELLIQSLLADDILTESMAESIMVCEYRYTGVSTINQLTVKNTIFQMTVNRCSTVTYVSYLHLVC